MTPQQILSSVRAQVDESAARYWTDAEIYVYMSQAEYQLAAEVRCTEARQSGVALAGEQEMYAPSDMLILSVVRWNGVKLKKIDQTEYEALANTGYGGATTQGNPAYYYEYQGDLGRSIGLFPIPSTTANLTFWYIKLPPVLSSYSTSLTVPAVFAPAITDYVLYRMFLKDQDARAQVHYQAWQQGMANARSTWNMMRFGDQHLRVKDVDAMLSTDLGMI